MQIKGIQNEIIDTLLAVMMPVRYLFENNTTGVEAPPHLLDNIPDWPLKNTFLNSFLTVVVNKEIIPAYTPMGGEWWARKATSGYANVCRVNLHQITNEAELADAYTNLVVPCLLAYNKRKGQLPVMLVFSLAALIRFYGDYLCRHPHQRNRNMLELMDKLWERYPGTTESYRLMVRTVLGFEPYWGQDMSVIPGLTETVAQHLMCIHSEGFVVALRKVVRR